MFHLLNRDFLLCSISPLGEKLLKVSVVMLNEGSRKYACLLVGRTDGMNILLFGPFAAFKHDSSPLPFGKYLLSML